MRKPKPPCVVAEFSDGTNEKVWCTFGDDQIDLAIKSEVTWNFIRDNLLNAGRS
jgi:sucrose phosphorylase